MTPGVELAGAVALVSSDPRRPELAATIEESERRGQPVTLVCLDAHRHEHEPTRADLLHVPRISAGVLVSLAAAFARRPGRVLLAFLRARGGAARAIHLARLLQHRGIAEIRGTDDAARRIASIAAQFCDAKRADLSELPADWSRIAAGRIGVRSFSRHINSITAELSLDGDARRVVVKRQRSHAGGSAHERWTRECRVLRALNESMREGRFTVPRVLVYDEEHALVVMERAPGRSLDTLFLAAASDPAAMRALGEGVRAAGAWLAAMQAVTRGSDDGRALLDDLVRTAVADVATLAKGDRVIRRRQRGIVARIEALHRRVSGHSLRVVGHHDDYWPGNIFFDGARVTVIDFESYREGLPLEDAAFFLIRCEVLRRRFRLRFPDVESRFFEGYGRGEAPDRDALQLFTVTKGLRLLARGAGLDLPLPQRLWTRRAIRDACLAALRD